MYTALRPMQNAFTKNPPVVTHELQATSDNGSIAPSKVRQTMSRTISTSSIAFGIRYVRSERLLAGQCPLSRQSGSDDDFPSVVEYEYSVSLPFVQYGISMSQQTPFGSILPALRVYPIIDDFHSDSLLWKMESWNVQTLQMDMRSGLVHPFTRDRYHRSLLHVGW
jgi:hypothetical protein